MRKAMQQACAAGGFGQQCLFTGLCCLRPSMASRGLALHLGFLLARRGVSYIQTFLDNFCFSLQEPKCYLSKANWLPCSRCCSPQGAGHAWTAQVVLALDVLPPATLLFLFN